MKINAKRVHLETGKVGRRLGEELAARLRPGDEVDFLSTESVVSELVRLFSRWVRILATYRIFGRA